MQAQRGQFGGFGGAQHRGAVERALGGRTQAEMAAQLHTLVGQFKVNTAATEVGRLNVTHEKALGMAAGR